MISVVRFVHRLAQAEPDPRLGGRVDGGGCVVEDEHARVDRERTRDRDPLALAARERDAALADDGVVALRQPLDELVRLGEPCDARHVLVGELGQSEGDVLAHGRGEEERLLRDDADLAAQRAQRHVADVDAVERDAAGRHVVEARHERGERRLAGAGVADQRDRGAGGDVEVDVLQHRLALAVRERDALEPDHARSRRELDRARPVGDLLRLVEHLEDPLARRRRALRLADPHAERAQRQDEHGEEEEDRGEAARRSGCRPRPCARRSAARPPARPTAGTRAAACRSRAGGSPSASAGRRAPSGTGTSPPRPAPARTP